MNDIIWEYEKQNEFKFTSNSFPLLNKSEMKLTFVPYGNQWVITSNQN